MWEADIKLKQLQAWELLAYLGELEAGRPLESLALPVDSKPQKEDQGDIDEDGATCMTGKRCCMRRAMDQSQCSLREQKMPTHS